MTHRKIPDHAKCVFKGVIFDVYHYEKEFYDGSMKTVEILKRPDTVCVLAMQGDTIFFSKESQPWKPGPYYTLIGGRMDPDEMPLDAAKRELMEEAGMISDDWQLLETINVHNKIEWNIHIFVAREVHKVSDQQLDGGEEVEIMNMPLETFFREIVMRDDFQDQQLKAWISGGIDEGALAKWKNKILDKI